MPELRPAAQPDADTVRRAEALYAEWKGKKERRVVGVDRGLLLDALAEPSSPRYFVAWLRGTELGDFLYRVDPGERTARVFGFFFDEKRSPKRVLYDQAVEAAAAGKTAEAAALFDRAIAAEEPAPEEGETVYWQVLQWIRRQLNARIETSRCRLLLDQGRDGEAVAALDRARHVVGRDDDDVTLLQARLEVRRGEYEKAFRRLRKRAGAEGDLDDAEVYALLAIAAQKTGHTEELERALKKAREYGVDVAALVQPQS